MHATKMRGRDAAWCQPSRSTLRQAHEQERWSANPSARDCYRHYQMAMLRLKHSRFPCGKFQSHQGTYQGPAQAITLQAGLAERCTCRTWVCRKAACAPMRGQHPSATVSRAPAAAPHTPSSCSHPSNNGMRRAKWRTATHPRTCTWHQLPSHDVREQPEGSLIWDYSETVKGLGTLSLADKTTRPAEPCMYDAEAAG